MPTLALTPLLNQFGIATAWG